MSELVLLQRAVQSFITVMMVIIIIMLWNWMVIITSWIDDAAVEVGWTTHLLDAMQDILS
jgi:hypothetical protein